MYVYDNINFVSKFAKQMSIPYVGTSDLLRFCQIGLSQFEEFHYCRCQAPDDISDIDRALCADLFGLSNLITGAIWFEKDSSVKINIIRSCAKTFPRGLGHGCSLCAEFLPRGQSVGELSTNDCLRVLIDLFCLLDGSLGAKLGGD